MLPSNWPSWTLILIALGLVVLTVVIGLALEPAVQAITPYVEPTPEVASLPPQLPYAAPSSGGCVECHVSEASLENAGADQSTVQRVLLDEDSPMSLHGRLGCVTCHDGIGTTQDLDAAHEDLVADPSHPDKAETYCVPCHHDLGSAYPERNLQAPHDRILRGIREDKDVCSCSNCHGSVAHGPDPLASHDVLAASMDYCVDCHVEKDVPPERLKCYGCHIGPHDVALAMDCETCHVSTDTWSKVELAVHPVALDNGHGELECFECHIQPDFRSISGFTCSDCHAKPHAFGGEDCAECHTTPSWSVSAMEGHAFPIAHDGADGTCTACHPGGDTSAYYCFSCHEASTTLSAHERGGVTDIFSKCVDCHQEG